MQRLQNPLPLETLNSKIVKFECEILGFREPGVRDAATQKSLAAPNPKIRNSVDIQGFKPPTPSPYPMVVGY